MPVKVCAEPTCRNVATARGRCDEHRHELERNRSRVRREDAGARNRMYASAKWHNTRKAQRLRQSLCELEGPGRLGLANEVHHVVAMDAGAPPATSTTSSPPASHATPARPARSRTPGVGRVDD